MKTLKMMTACLLIASAAAWGGETVDRTLAADQDAVIEIENLSGSIRITGWDRSEIRVTGTLGDDVEELRFEGERDRFQIAVKIPEGRGFGKRDVSADLEISVPAGSGLEIETVSAPITVVDVNSWVELSSVSGNIEVNGSMTEAEMETVSGSIRLSGANTVVEAESVSGTVEIEGTGQAVEVSTVSGSVKVAAGEVKRARFESVAGGIDFDGSLAAGGRLDASCHSCNLVVTLPGTTSATFELSSFSGNISSDLGGTVEKTSRYAPGTRSEFSTGGGDGRVSLETFSGNVKLKKK
jgi:DUF4097 and DUF4098 domain-containing protein YvlB